MGLLSKKKKFEDVPEPEDELDLDDDDLEEEDDEEDEEDTEKPIAAKSKETFPKYPKETTKKTPKPKESQATQPQMIVKKLIETGWINTDKFAQEIINEIAIYRENENRRKLLLEDLEALGMLEEE